MQLYQLLCVTRPAKINHVSANYTELHFANIFGFECGIPFPQISEERLLNSVVVMKIVSFYFVGINSL